MQVKTVVFVCDVCGQRRYDNVAPGWVVLVVPSEHGYRKDVCDTCMATYRKACKEMVNSIPLPAQPKSVPGKLDVLQAIVERCVRAEFAERKRW